MQFLKTSLLAFVFILLISPLAHAAKPEPIKAVMYVGGCCHDYDKMPIYLKKEIAKLANIDIEVRKFEKAEEMATEFHKPDFGKNFDVIIYNMCWGEKWKDGDYDPALKLAEEGKPIVFVHCSMHTYRAPRDLKAPDLAEKTKIVDAKWHALIGMDTRVHDKKQPFSTVKVDEKSPIIKSFPANWKTENDELYNTVKMMPSAKPLLQATSPISGKTHTVAWTNTYGKARIFGTTLGHDMITGADANYHQLLTNGILWAVEKLDENGKPAEGYQAAK